MTANRFDLPAYGEPTVVQFPAIRRRTLSNNLSVWTIPQETVPVATIVLVVRHGSADDPSDRHGLASLTGDLLDEGAGSRDAVELADALARLGTTMQVDVGPDATTVSVTVLSRFIVSVLALLADVVIRPRLADADFQRVRELRVNRLRQLRQSSNALADRAFASAIYPGHAYGHGGLGTSTSLARTTSGDPREFWASRFSPASATLILSGDAGGEDTFRAVEDAFSSWSHAGREWPAVPVPADTTDARVLIVDRPGAPQAELRVGHRGPTRNTPDYHSLVVANALLGGTFTSRINHRLREEKGITYGARTSFDFRLSAGSFSCETSVQSNATAVAVADILSEFADVRGNGAVPGDELDRAKASLTRGYVRNFETAGQLARAATSLVVYGLDDRIFDQFVPAVGAVTTSDVHEVASRYIRPDEATIVVVGDAASLTSPLESLGRRVVHVTPEF